LCIRWWTFGLHKMRGISWVAEDILASQEGLCSMELVSLVRLNIKHKDFNAVKIHIRRFWVMTQFLWSWPCEVYEGVWGSRSLDLFFLYPQQ
jgi:hypothetical protein